MSISASTESPDKEYDTFVVGHRDRRTGKVIPPRKIRCPECGVDVRRHGNRFSCGCGAETTMELTMGKKVYRVVLKDNPYVSPFPDEIWPTREAAEKFADVDAPDGWAGKLVVVESEE
jgi:hypothetical protein